MSKSPTDAPAIGSTGVDMVSEVLNGEQVLSRRTVMTSILVNRIMRALCYSITSEGHRTSFAEGFRHATSEELGYAVDLAIHQKDRLMELDAPAFICESKENQIKFLQSLLQRTKALSDQEFAAAMLEKLQTELEESILQRLCDFVTSDLPIGPLSEADQEEMWSV